MNPTNMAPQTFGAYATMQNNRFFKHEWRADQYISPRSKYPDPSGKFYGHPFEKIVSELIKNKQDELKNLPNTNNIDVDYGFKYKYPRKKRPTHLTVNVLKTTDTPVPELKDKLIRERSPNHTYKLHTVAVKLFRIDNFWKPSETRIQEAFEEAYQKAVAMIQAT